MKRFFRNFIIIFICDIIALTIASIDVIPNDWKLHIMFLAGIIAGAIIAVIEEIIYDKEINKLNTND